MVTGTDEHGQKVADAARAAASPSVQQFTDEISSLFSHLNATFHVGNDVFIRTTSQAHQATVRWLWRRLAARGALKSRQYSGWYCRSDECFVPEGSTMTRREYWVKKKGGSQSGDPEQRVSAESGHPVEWVTETNWVFPLTKYREQLLALLDAPPTAQGGASFVFPPDRSAQIRAHVAGQALQDLSVSRPSSRVPWAIRVPGDDSQSMYVWLDALANYLTAARGAHVLPTDDTELPDDADLESLFPHWPSASRLGDTVLVHVVGKDIAKFHAIYWPAFLLAADIPTPSHIITHAHFTVDHVKMSKSLGNVVDPHSLIKPAMHHAPDAIRYFLLREGSHSVDSDFNAATLEQRTVKECASTFGNLINRIATAKFVPLGRLSLAVGRVDVQWPAGGAGSPEGLSPVGPGARQQQALHESLELHSLPPLSVLVPQGTILPGAVSGHAALAALSPELRHYLWPEPSFGPLSFTTAQQEQLLLLVDLAQRTGAAYAEARAGAALTAIMHVLQEANRVHYENAPWKMSATETDIATWKAHAQALVARAGSAVQAALQDSEVSTALKMSDTPEAIQVTAFQAALVRILQAGNLPSLPAAPVLTDQHMQLMAALVSIIETIRVCCILLQPAMPRASPALLSHLGFDARVPHPCPPTGVHLRAPLATLWTAAQLGAAQPHHYLIGRPRGDPLARTNYPLLSGPVAGPVAFPQPWEAPKAGAAAPGGPGSTAAGGAGAGKRKNALGARKQQGKGETARTGGDVTQAD